MANTHMPLSLVLSLAALVGVPRALEAQTVQLRANDNDERWGDRTSPTSQGKLLWFERDGTTNKDDVYLFNGATASLLQAQGGLTNVDAPVFALGTGATPGSVIAVWRRDTDFAWMSVNGGPPQLVSATNPSDPAVALNPEGAGIADGCVFLVLQDLSGTFARKHIFRVDTATAVATILTDPATFPITGAAVGAPRVTTSGCRAAWLFLDGTGATPTESKLHFYDGANVSVVDSGEIGEPHLSQGRVVYAKTVSGISQVFVYDSTADAPAPMQLTRYTDPTRTNSHAKTDGRHVAWLRQTTDNVERHVVLNGGLQLTTSATKPADGRLSIDFPIQLQRGQMIWKDAAGALRYLSKTGVATVPVAPTLTVTNPWLADGFIAFTGTSTDGGADAEPFLFSGTPPAETPQPSPPLLVRATPGNGQITVAWDRILGATSYNLYCAREPGVTRDNYLSLLGGTRVAGVTPPFTLSGLTNGTTYYVVVTAAEDAVEGGSSGEASATPRAPFCVKPGGGGGCASSLTTVLANAVPGDTIRVAAGTYREYVAIDKTITLEGGWNATFTARDPTNNLTTIRPPGNPPDASFSVVSIEGEAADPGEVAPTVDGFTITGGGGGNHGGGLRVWHSQAVVRNNVIRNNVGFLLGGGVWAVGGAPRFEHNRIEDNVCDGQGQGCYGGGIHLAGTQATLVGNVIASNGFVDSALSYGGGLSVLGGGPITLSGSSIVSNSTGGSLTEAKGGGVYLESVAATLSANVVQANAARSADGYGGFGGGLFMLSVTATLTGNTIESNVAGGGTGVGRGGGIFMTEDVTATLTDNVIRGNAAETEREQVDVWGGGLYMSDVEVTLVNNVIADNTLYSPSELGYGGGLYIGSSTATLSGNTISGNVANRASRGNGGGMAVRYSTLSMRGDQIVDNQGASQCGGFYGGLSAYDSELDLDRVRVQRNCATYPDGGNVGGLWIRVRNSFRLTNSLVTDNACPGVGGLAVAGDSQGSVEIANNTFVANGGTGISAALAATLVNNIIAGHAYGVLFGSNPTAFDHNLFWNNMTNTNYPGGTNLTGDPLLDANHAISRGSPAIDAGRNDAVSPGRTLDMAGHPRFLDDILTADTGLGTPPIVDVGAFEFAAGGDLIFEDGFESGDLSGWSAGVTDGGDLSVSPSAALALTNHGLQGVVDDTAGLYVQDDSPLDENRYRARFYFDPNGFDPGEAFGHFRTRIFIGFEENPVRRLMAIVLRRQNGQYGVMGRARRDDNTQADTGFFSITDAPHVIEVEWRRATTSSSNDGEFRLWIDGVIRSSLSGIANHLSSVDFVRLGALSVKAGASGTLYWDQFASRRVSYIGPE